jgi:hypothetical protein
VVHDFTDERDAQAMLLRALETAPPGGGRLGEDAAAATFALDPPTTHPRAATPGREGSRRVS